MSTSPTRKITPDELREAMHPTFDSAIRHAAIRRMPKRAAPAFTVTAWSVFSVVFVVMLFLAGCDLAAKAPGNIRLTLQQAGALR